jgi:hypothetical protein
MLDNLSQAFVIYLSTSIFFLWGTLPISCLSSSDCVYLFFRLINHKIRIKISPACIHNISLATVAIREILYHVGRATRQDGQGDERHPLHNV